MKYIYWINSEWYRQKKDPGGSGDYEEYDESPEDRAGRRDREIRRETAQPKKKRRYNRRRSYDEESERSGSSY